MALSCLVALVMGDGQVGLYDGFGGLGYGRAPIAPYGRPLGAFGPAPFGGGALGGFGTAPYGGGFGGFGGAPGAFGPAPFGAGIGGFGRPLGGVGPVPYGSAFGGVGHAHYGGAYGGFGRPVGAFGPAPFAGGHGGFGPAHYAGGLGGLGAAPYGAALGGFGPAPYRPAPFPSYGGYQEPGYYPPSNYQFGYGVQSGDHYGAATFGHNEEHNAYGTNGHYHVNTPGSFQTVSYNVPH